MWGLLVDKYNKDIKSKFLFTMKNYDSNMIYNENNQKYKVTYNKPTPFLYKNQKYTMNLSTHKCSDK